MPTMTEINNIHVGPGQLQLNRGEDTYIYAATEQGGVLNYSRALAFVDADEVFGRVVAYVEGEEGGFELNALEIDAELIREAIGHGTITTVAAGASVAGADELELGGAFTLPESSLVYTTPRRHNPNLNIILELYRVVANVSIDPRFSRGGGRTMYRARFEALLDMDKAQGTQLGKITIETEEPTG